MEVTGFGFRLRVGVVGVLVLVFYRLLDKATVVGVRVLVALVEGGFAGAKVSDFVSLVAATLRLTLDDASSWC